MRGICKIEACGLLVRAHQLCNRHAQQKYRIDHPQRSKDIQRAWGQRNIEQKSVRDHYHNIFLKQLPSYIGMPFFPAWSPKTGGSYNAGAQWIIENLGHRPDKNHHLHIVDRRLGFVPNNLVWVPREKHRQAEMMNRLLLEVQNLRAENERLRSIR